jgi:N-acetylglucosaminyl-diphospho-decaprenol L-rhamnosyltransferase
MTRVAIVIVTFNSGEEIGACLDALAAVSDVEVIVVDNASHDGTADKVIYRGVRLIRNSGNAGFAAAVNQGVRATAAPLVLLLNPDAVLVRGLDALVSRCEMPGVGAAGGMLIGPDGLPQAGFMVRNLPSATALIYEVLGINRLWPGNRVNWHYRCRGLDPMTSARVEQPAGAFLMFPRAVWEIIGGFDEKFHPVWFEDVDFCARLRSANFSIYYEPNAVARHEGAHSIHRISLMNRENYWYGNLLEYAAKHYRYVAFRTICAAVVAGSLMRAVRAIPAGGMQALEVYGKVIRLATGRFFKPRQDRAGSVALKGEETRS